DYLTVMRVEVGGVRKLILQVVGNQAVFVFHRTSSGDGGYLARVWPGGEFRGLNFDQLHSLGSGEHQLDLDEHLPVRQGTEPRYESAWTPRVDQFRFGFFRYYVNASSPIEVLNSAREVIRLESESKPT